MNKKELTQIELIADMLATYPGILARPGYEFGKDYAGSVWTGGEAEMQDGSRIFNSWADGDNGYDGGVLIEFTAWLDSRGWYLENYDGQVFLAYPDSIHEPYRKYEAMKREWSDKNPTAGPGQYEAAMREIAKNCGV